MNDEKETPLQKAARRTGGCIATTCKGLPDGQACEAFAFASYLDGFNTCVCGHTQHSHAFAS